MFPLSKTLDEFIDALQHKQSIILNSSGFWRYQTAFNYILDKISKGKKSSFLQLCKAFIEHLDRLESVPVQFNTSGLVAEQKEDFRSTIIVAKILENQLSEYSSPEFLKELKRLQRRIIGLQYRIEEINGGMKKLPIDPEQCKQLRILATQWKQSQKIFWNNDLSAKDLLRLESACHYRKFIKILLEDPELQGKFFKWILRDGISSAPFIEFPAFQEKIFECELTGRIGRFGEETLKIKKENCGFERMRKILTLPFEGNDISILDEELEIKFRGNYRLKMKDIFVLFKYKDLKVGNLEFFPQGIINWNVQRLGWWNADAGKYETIDLERPEWWLQFPVFERLTIEAAKKRYGTHMDGWHWNLEAKASRGYLSLNFEKTHAYLEMAIPTHDGYYAVYDFGLFTTVVPQSTWQWMTFFAASLPAVVAYPDENVFKTTRQHAGYSFELTPREGRGCMETIKNDILMARQGHVTYQFEVENCGKWIQDLLVDNLGIHRVPNLYRMPFHDLEFTKGFLGRLAALVRKFSPDWQIRFIMFFHLIFGAWKGRWILDKNGQKVWVSLAASSFMHDNIIYHPAYLHKQREIGSLANEPNRQIHFLKSDRDTRETPIGLRVHDYHTIFELFNDNLSE